MDTVLKLVLMVERVDGPATGRRFRELADAPTTVLSDDESNPAHTKLAPGPAARWFFFGVGRRLRTAVIRHDRRLVGLRPPSRRVGDRHALQAFVHVRVNVFGERSEVAEVVLENVPNGVQVHLVVEMHE
jgi:hypothetical protein